MLEPAIYKEDKVMTDVPGRKRTDTESRVVDASPQMIYRAFLDPEAWVSWLPPKGMSGRIETFEPREGGKYRMTLTYRNADHPAPGKTSENADTVEGKFLEFVPNERVVQEVEFESGDPAFAGAMKMTWSLTALDVGTEVRIICENVPEGISKEDHDAGLKSTLENLAAYVE
jgi:uncharacterized protein YndB with AHSA1/START domain